MKKIITFLAVIVVTSMLCSYSASRQELVVSKIQGAVMLQDGTDKVQLSQGRRLSLSDIVVLPEGSNITLLDPVARKQYLLSGDYIGTIDKYIQDNSNNCTKTTTEKFMNYLLAQVYKGNKPVRSNIEDDHATVIREVDLFSTDSVSAQISDSLALDTVLIDLEERCCDISDSVHVVKCCRLCPCGCNGKKNPIAAPVSVDTLRKDSVVVPVEE